MGHLEILETEPTQATLHATMKTCWSEFSGAGTMEASKAVHVQPFDIGWLSQPRPQFLEAFV